MVLLPVRPAPGFLGILFVEERLIDFAGSFMISLNFNLLKAKVSKRVNHFELKIEVRVCRFDIMKV